MLDFNEISHWLAEVHRLAAPLNPTQELLVGGGSARDILDHIYTNQPFQTRDIDLFFVLGSQVAPEMAQGFFDSLQRAGLGEMKASALREKRRCHPGLPAPERYQYVVGFGAHLFRPGMPILSVTLLHTEADLTLNGLLNIDKIYLRLAPGQTLRAFGEKIRQESLPHHSLVERGLIRDDHRGYAAWVDSQPELLNWFEVERSPTRMAVRVIRSYAKAGQPQLPDAVALKFRNLLAQTPEIDDEVEFKRGFVKVFSDRHWDRELQSLAEIGILGRISPELERVAREPQGGSAAHAHWRNRWESVMNQLPRAESRRLERAFQPAMASSFAH